MSSLNDFNCERPIYGFIFLKAHHQEDQCEPRSNCFRSTHTTSFAQRVPSLCRSLSRQPSHQKLFLLGSIPDMAFAQLTFRESLREIEDSLGALQSKLYHMGFHS